MDKENYQNICSLAKNNSQVHKVKMILNEINPSENLSVPDPYYGGDKGFKNVYILLNEACEKISKKL
jgi:protein-tyrosine phosphatase